MTGYYPEAICHQCGQPLKPGSLRRYPIYGGAEVEMCGYCETHGMTRVDWRTE